MRHHLLQLGLAAALLLGGVGAAPALRPATGPAVAVPSTGLTLEVPEGWRPGGLYGAGVLLSYIGSGDGYPRLSVTTDPEAEPIETTDAAALEEQVEQLFEALVEAQPSSLVLESGWTTVNGLRAFDTTMRWPSVAGDIQARRLLLAHAGRFYIFDWIERAARFDPVADAIEDSLRSLRLGQPAKIVAAR